MTLQNKWVRDNGLALSALIVTAIISGLVNNAGDTATVLQKFSFLTSPVLILISIILNVGFAYVMNHVAKILEFKDRTLAKAFYYIALGMAFGILYGIFIRIAHVSPPKLANVVIFALLSIALIKIIYKTDLLNAIKAYVLKLIVILAVSLVTGLVLGIVLAALPHPQSPQNIQNQSNVNQIIQKLPADLPLPEQSKIQGSLAPADAPAYGEIYFTTRESLASWQDRYNQYFIAHNLTKQEQKYMDWALGKQTEVTSWIIHDSELETKSNTLHFRFLIEGGLNTVIIDIS